MSFRNETMEFHQERIRVLKLDIEHLQRVIESHMKVANDHTQDPAERAYCELSAARTSKHVHQKQRLLEEFQRGAVNFSITSQVTHQPAVGANNE